MIKSVKIIGYRGLKNFSLDSLGSINLIVGKNNSGKSSILESLYLLAAGGDPFAIWNILTRRGERMEEITERRYDAEVDISHLFHGHNLELGSKIQITTKNHGDKLVNLCVQERTVDDEKDLFSSDGDEALIQKLVLKIEGKPEPSISTIPLTPRGGLRTDTFRRIRMPSVTRMMAQYISTESLTPLHLIRMWNDIVLTDAEERVLTALRFLEPRVERIAATGEARDYPYTQRGGFKIKLRGVPDPIPIGSLGDGSWRMLVMAISLIKAKDSILLVDEIDTGLHYSVLEGMWKFVSQTAQEFNVQVFATTHSYDCIRSLAGICNQPSTHNVSIQRIEPEKERTIPFDEAEIRAAASADIELR